MFVDPSVGAGDSAIVWGYFNFATREAFLPARKVGTRISSGGPSTKKLNQAAEKARRGKKRSNVDALGNQVQGGVDGDVALPPAPAPVPAGGTSSEAAFEEK